MEELPEVVGVCSEISALFIRVFFNWDRSRSNTIPFEVSGMQLDVELR